MTLKDVRIGEKVMVTSLSGDGPIKRRIMDMGFTKGAEVFVRKFAPLGDPMQISIRGYEITIRKKDADMIVVERSNSTKSRI